MTTVPFACYHTVRDESGRCARCGNVAVFTQVDVPSDHAAEVEALKDKRDALIVKEIRPRFERLLGRHASYADLGNANLDAAKAIYKQARLQALREALAKINTEQYYPLGSQAAAEIEAAIAETEALQ